MIALSINSYHRLFTNCLVTDVPFHTLPCQVSTLSEKYLFIQSCHRSPFSLSAFSEKCLVSEMPFHSIFSLHRCPFARLLSSTSAGNTTHSLIKSCSRLPRDTSYFVLNMAEDLLWSTGKCSLWGVLGLLCMVAGEAASWPLAGRMTRKLPHVARSLSPGRAPLWPSGSTLATFCARREPTSLLLLKKLIRSTTGLCFQLKHPESLVCLECCLQHSRVLFDFFFLTRCENHEWNLPSYIWESHKINLEKCRL